jgi:diguanylate cyclase (GGDEF)-like protein
MDKRAFERQAVDFKIILKSQPIKDQVCRVKDFCFGGMLLTVEAKDIAKNPNITTLIRNDLVDIQIQLPEHGNRPAGEYSISAKIARIDGLNMGIAFIKPDSNTIAGIQKLANLDSKNDPDKMTAAEFTSDLETIKHHFDLEARKEAKSKYPESQERILLKKALDFIESYFEKNMSDFFQQLQKDVMEAIEMAKDNAEQNALFDANNKFSKYAQKAENDIKRELSFPFSELALKGNFDLAYLKKDSGTQKLSLIEKGDFEDWLIVKVMATKVETSNNELLQELQIRLKELSGLASGVQNNPISPAVICYAFNQTMSSLPVELNLRKIIYSSFETNVALKLDKFYRAFNDFFAEQGILKEFDILDHIGKITPKRNTPPRIPAKNEQESGSNAHTNNESDSIDNGYTQSGVGAAQNGGGSSEASSQQTQTENSGNEAGGNVHQLHSDNANTQNSSGNSSHNGSYQPTNNVSALENSGTQEPEILREKLSLPEGSSNQYQQLNVQQQIARNAAETVKNLINNHRNNSSNIFQLPKQDLSKPAFEKKAVKSTLQTLQSQSSNEDYTLPLSQRLHAALQENQSEEMRIGDEEGAAINLTERLFDSILDLKNINADLQQWIKKLEIPFAKLLIQDEGFLQNVEHPARKVLNTIAKLGRSGIFTNESNTKLVDKTIDKLVEEFESDISVFNSANHELEDLLERQEKIYKKNLHRVKEAAQGQFKTKAAKRFVDKTLEDSIAEQDIPKALATLLDAGWRDLLNITVVKHGADSAEWKEYEGVVQTMIQTLNSDREKPDLKPILSSIKNGLNSISPSGEFKDARTISELKQLFTAKQTDEIPSVSFPQGTFSEENKADESEIEEIWIKRAKKLNIGDWLEVDSDANIFSQDDQSYDDEGNIKITKAQMRIAWHDEDREEFVFVNHQGMKVIDVEVLELAGILQNGKATLIEDQNQPVVDLGLDKMVHKFYEQLVHHASTDELTGLKNRREFERQLKNALRESRNRDIKHMIAIFDFNQVKEINEKLSYEAGDEFLKQISELITKNTPKNTTKARLSSDQFSILLPKADKKTSAIIFKHLKKQIDAFSFNFEKTEFFPNCSIGTALIDSNTKSASSALTAALQACEKAQAQSKDKQTVIEEAEDSSESDSLQKWLNRIDTAIEEQKLQLMCQKISPLNDDSMPDQYEILLSIKDEQDAEINIADFIHAAECSDKMQLLDRWVIKNVLSWMQHSPEIVSKMGNLGINLSSHSLNDEELLYFIFENLVEQDKVPKPKVCFEVSESIAVNNVADLADFINEMQNIGCQFSLDDFGSESSSYNFLKNLSLNYVKLDGSFIRNLNKNETDFAMVKSMNDMVHFLGKKTIANEVEDDETIQALKEIGVDYIQGKAVEMPLALANL